MIRSLASATLTAAVGLALAAPNTLAQVDPKSGKPMTKEQKQTMERMVKNNLEKCYGVAARACQLLSRATASKRPCAP